MIDYFPKVLNLNRLFLKLNQWVLKLAAGSEMARGSHLPFTSRVALVAQTIKLVGTH